MTRDKKVIVVNEWTHERVGQLAKEAGITRGQLIEGLVNMLENRVNYAKAKGIIQ